jgi:hypothetical protein
LYPLQPHKTVLDKYGKPEDVMPGIRAVREPLPRQPVSGMYNKSGGKVRLTFKLEANQVWIGTKGEPEVLFFVVFFCFSTHDILSPSSSGVF